MHHDDAIYVAGADSLVGKAIVRQLQSAGYRHLRGIAAGEAPDLLDRKAVEAFFATWRPRYVFHAAGVSGGIGANDSSPADLCAANLTINVNLLESARRFQVARLLYLASSCCYPERAPQPLMPASLGTGPLEPISEAYATAKLAGISLCKAAHKQDGCDFIVGIPTTVFGPGDHADAQRGHVIPSLMERFHQACLQNLPRVQIWGSGAAVREFIAADDLASACLALMQHSHPPRIVNLGSGQTLSIRELVAMLVEITGYTGQVVFDRTRPDGAAHKELNSDWLLQTGWRPNKSLRDWLFDTYAGVAARHGSQGEHDPGSAADPNTSVVLDEVTPAADRGANMVITPAPGTLDATLYRELFRIRRVEEEIARVYPSDRIQSPVHLSIGQEAISVAVCQALRANDVAFGSYRSHAYFLAKGGNLRGMIAELYGKATGVAKGKAGSMHLIDAAAGVMGASAIVASTLPQAVGYALGIQSRGEDRVVAVFCGEGATEEGVFAESLNFAALKRLPILFVCENNAYAIHSRQADRQSNLDIAARARSFGMESRRFDQMDIYELFAASCEAVESLRQGSGPRFFECCCYRWMEHVGPSQDFAVGYRKAEDAQSWIENDALKIVSARLEEGVRREIETQVEEEIHDAFAFAESSLAPAGDELLTDLYA